MTNGNQSMQIHIVHVHPEATSYNGALTQVAERTLCSAGSRVTVSDLYRAKFDPVERPEHYVSRIDTGRFAVLGEQRNAWATNTLPDDIVVEIDKLKRADLVILQFPLWWHGPPAMLKGWMDRVFVSGGLYTSKMRYNTGYFGGRRALLSVTTGAPQAAFGPDRRGGNIDTMLWPVHYSMHYMGFSVLPPFVSYGVQGHGYSYESESSLQDRLKCNLKQWSSYLMKLDNIQPLTFPDWTNWNEDGGPVA